MNTKQLSHLAIAVLLAVLLLPCAPGAKAQGTTFTYQGRLSGGANPAEGIYDLRFTIYDLDSGGSIIAGPITNRPTAVSNGLFTVTLDFGSVFPGADRWLEIGVRTNGGGAFAALTPRQQLTATPYAVTAGHVTGVVPNAGLSGVYSNAVTLNNPGNQFTGNFSGGGSGLSNVNALTLGGLVSSSFWQLGGNASTTPGTHFLGTTDNQPLELKVSNVRAVRLERGTNETLNLLAGSPLNRIAAGVFGSTLSGGGASTSNEIIAWSATGLGFRSGSTFGAQHSNHVGGNYATITGGRANFIGSNSFQSMVGGGALNQIGDNGQSSVIAGGTGNRIGSPAGGSVIGGGVGNRVANTNVAATISGGSDNRVNANSPFATIGGGQFNEISAAHATIGGGEGHFISAAATHSAIGGGEDNEISGGAAHATIGGGASNTAFGTNSTVPGGFDNEAAGNFSFAAGRRARANHDGAFVWADSQNTGFASTSSNQFLIRAGGGVGIGTGSPSRALEVQHAGDTEVGLKSTDTGGHLWTLQSSGVSGSANLDASFQIIDRTRGVSRLLIGTNGNVGIGTSNPTNRLHVNGGITCTALVQTSDRNAKENFQPVSVQDILAKVTALPISRWNFKEMQDGPHVGPMAQDFYAAFHLGGSDQSITSLDADGVALAAIQGLNQKVDGELKAKDARIEALEKELAALKELITKLSTTRH